MKSKFLSTLIAVLIISSLILGACTTAPTVAPTAPAAQPAQPTDVPAAQPVELQYWLWDSNQLPAYQACADAFTKQNPNITIKILQQGWGQYWDALTTGFAAGTAPDVFTNHLSKYAQFISEGLLMDIQPMVQAENINLDQYKSDPDLWVKDGKRYGLPKDWDTIAIFYNVDMLQKAGIDPKIMDTWTWDPTTGGTFQEVVAKLTLDKNGNNGLSPDFDKDNVVQYGYVAGVGDAGSGGQTEWGAFAASTGFRLTDKPWTATYNYDDPRLASTLQWWADLRNVHGFAPNANAMSGSDSRAIFKAKQAAMTTDGSWEINDLTKGVDFKVGIGMLPAGPEGVVSPINGLSDAIWSGTKHPQEALMFVKFLASPDCANIVGDYGVVFPAIQSGVDKAMAKHKADGIDVSAFTKATAITYLLPLTDHGNEVTQLVAPVLQSIFDGSAKAADVLPQLKKDIDALFK
ncbi:MAG: sugar ABC transporter substrate-binding protein [Chloroflexota bacterium]|nr:MAG: sugar ABC transporter substrate-binding protein [Chloroflexota bacterium]